MAFDEMKPSKAFSTRYDAAKKWRDQVKRDIIDALKFCDNGRENDFDDDRNDSGEDIFCSYAEEYATDLAGDLVTYFTPPEVRWSEFEVTVPVEEDMLKQVEAQVQEREDKIFELIEASNYYDVAPQVFFEAASHGTTAMWVTKSHIHQPLFIEAVTPDELLIVPGHNGILDRFREQKVLAEHLQVIFDGWNVELDQRHIKEKIKKDGATVDLCWGFWVDWADPAMPKWMHEVTVDGHRITEERQILGPLAGSCPLMVGRFNPRPRRPWGRGPAIKALSDIFTIDRVSEMVLDNLDAAMSPTWTYPDDGMLDMSNGIPRGTTVPARPGAADQFRKLELGGELDYGWFSEERLAERLRVAFYQDGPRQRGDTPPSATQWIDEARRIQKRIGKPSAPLFSEMIIPFIQRVEYLAVQQSKIPEQITHAGDKLNVAPISPLQKAQNQDKVLIARSNLDTAFQSFGEQAAEVVDLPETLRNIKEASGDELLVIREAPQNDDIPPEVPTEPTA